MRKSPLGGRNHWTGFSIRQDSFYGRTVYTKCGRYLLVSWLAAALRDGLFEHLRRFRHQNHYVQFQRCIVYQASFPQPARTFPSYASQPIDVSLSFQTDNLAIMATMHPVRHDVQIHMRGRAVSCPVCGSKYCRRSVRHGYKDFLRRVVGWFPWHCRQCGDRFYWRKRSDG